MQVFLILLGYLACIQLPYICTLQYYKSQEAKAQAYLQSYIQSTYPQAELISFDQHLSYGLFESDLVGFQYTVRFDNEYYEISVSNADNSWTGKLDVIDDELAYKLEESSN